MNITKSDVVPVSQCPVTGSSLAEIFDPFDLTDPYPFYERARREEPIFYSPQLKYWVVTRYEDIKAIFKDPLTFSAEIAQSPYRPLSDKIRQILKEGGYEGASGLSARVPPDHTRLRQFVNKAFTPRRVASLEPFIREMTNGMIDRFSHDGQADLVSQLVYDLPALVIFTLLGIPKEDVPHVKQWTKSRILLTWGNLPLAEQEHHARQLVKYWQYCVRLVQERHEAARRFDDLPGDLVWIYKEGDRSITLHEIATLCYGQLIAGHETTTGLSALGLKNLLTYREQWEKICQNPDLIPHAIEEILRYSPSVFAWRRRVKKPVQMGGISLPEGANLLLVLGSANRDEAQFVEPQKLDILRENAKDHLSFGFGIHYCLGASLARLELKIILEELTRYLPHMRLMEGQVFEYGPNTSFRSPLHVWVEWEVEE
jgi:cytochrome P450